MAELTETQVRTIVREELRDNKIFDLPVQVAELKGEIQNVRTELKGEIQNVRTELKGDIAKLDAKVDGVISSNKTNFRLFLLTITAILGIYALILLKL